MDLAQFLFASLSIIALLCAAVAIPYIVIVKTLGWTVRSTGKTIHKTASIFK